jgi:hypothetical protein
MPECVFKKGITHQVTTGNDRQIGESLTRDVNREVNYVNPLKHRQRLRIRVNAVLADLLPECHTARAK